MSVAGTESRLTLEAAIIRAIQQDPWLNGSQQREVALRSESVSAGSLPDPRVSLMAGNFPVDSFDIGQEAMTQVSLGVAQMFPRGDSRQLSSLQKNQLADQEPMLRQDRQAKVRATITQLWLQAFKAQESIRLIRRDRSLFEQLVDATMASYASALGRARQQDVIRAQLELTRLEDRLTQLLQQQETAQQQLSEWIGAKAMLPLQPQIPAQQPRIPLTQLVSEAQQDQSLFEQVHLHPLLQAFDQRLQAMQTGVDLARQKYKPEWGLTAKYGYRDDDPLGRERADLFSVGVSFDVPLFTANRQDQDVRAASARAEALQTDRQLMIRQLVAELEKSIVQLQRLRQRQALYRKQLLPQMAEQAEAALTAYNNDDGDFAEAVRARIAEINARIEALDLAVMEQQTIANLNYLLSGAEAMAPEGEK